MIEIKDIAEYEDTDSELAKYTISDLHHRINKAIEYIENNKYDFEKWETQMLLGILKGSE